MAARREATIKLKAAEREERNRPALKQQGNTVSDVAAYLGISEWAVYRLKSRLGVRKPAGRLEFSAADVLAYERGRP